jgi:hypothetical protein
MENGVEGLRRHDGEAGLINFLVRERR